MSKTYETTIDSSNHHLIKKHLMIEFQRVASSHNATIVSEGDNYKSFIMQIKQQGGETQEIYISLKFHD